MLPHTDLTSGRVGQSWFAESFVSDKVAALLRSYSHTNQSPDFGREIKNMVKVARSIMEKEKQAREGVA